MGGKKGFRGIPLASAIKAAELQSIMRIPEVNCRIHQDALTKSNLKDR